ncbi:UvrD-helicase domain-containing protein [bacterium]|nr:UvrD-helicase domain-containing protein [bacterium]
MSSLTPHQQAAATHTHLSMSVISGAGSGKTRVLIERIRHIIESDKIPLYRILAFTFTEKAASEIKERLLSQNVIKPEEENNIHVGTLHAYCAELIRKYGVRLGINPAFTIGTEYDQQISKKARITSSIRKALDKGDETLLFYAKTLGLKRLVRLATQLLDHPRLTESRFYKDKTLDDPDAKLLYAVKSFYDVWLEEKIKEGKLYFNDLEYLAYLLLSTYPDVHEKEKKRFMHILVDEFQDINPLQGALIKKIHDPHVNKLFIVGDPKQSIYRFRNADVGVFLKFNQWIKENNGESIALNDTFRMTPVVSQEVNRVFKNLLADNNITFESIHSLSSNTGGLVKAVCVPKGKTADELRELEARYIARDILENRKSGKIALLFRSGTAMNVYQKILSDHGLPVSVTRTSDLLQIPVIRDLIHVMGHFAGDTTLLTQAGILKSVFYNLSEKFIHQYLSGKPRSLLDPYTPDLFISPSDHDKWLKLRYNFEYWQELSLILLPIPLLKEIITTLKISLSDNGYLEEFLMILENLPASFNESMTELYRVIKKLVADNEIIPTLPIQANPDAISLMTVHASKGLEFDTVYLPQLYARGQKEWEDYIFDDSQGLSVKKESAKPLPGLKVKLEESTYYAQLKEKAALAEKEETKRLLYVAMTRAKENLILFLKEPSKKIEQLLDGTSVNEWLWHLYAESSLMTPLSFSDEILSKKQEEPVSDMQHHMLEPIHNTHNTLHLTVSEIETFDHCPKQFHLRYNQNIIPVKNEQNLYASSHENEFLNAADWGTLLHEIMEFLDFKTLSNRQTVVDQALINQHIDDPDNRVKNKIIHTLDSLLGNGEIFGALAQNDELYSEWDFTYRHHDVILKGTIDRLYRVGNDWHVMDYKTDKIIKRDDIEKKINEYDIQMSLYAFAASRILGVSRIYTHLLFMDGPFVYKKEWNTAELTGVEIKLNEIINKMGLAFKDKKYALTENSDLCPTCPYYSKNYCGIKSKAFSN